jgi:short-subunit dehydrogenase
MEQFLLPITALAKSYFLTARLAAVPFSPAYSISKAAALSLSQSMRALVARQGLSVHAVLAGPVDTDMVRGLELPKTAPEAVAQAIFYGLEREEEEIFPDPWSASMADGWRNGVSKALERENAAFLEAMSVGS